ncbi:MAG: lysophospholipid acyltransferase family protein [Flavobacteriales bacterium]|nr:lysophospholipid acyltransferase family protein [Flavobacteriales bacterium]
MSAVGYYLALPFLYGIALLPFPLLYLLSDFTCLLLFGLIGYRKEVVLTNLRKSFPEKNEAEIRAIAKRFYRWFCDLTLETLKTLTISPDAVRSRVNFPGAGVFRSFAEKKQSVIIVMGHYGNWELAGARFAVEPGLHQLYVIYHPLQNPHFERLIVHMRTRLGNRLYAMQETFKGMVRDRQLLTATAFIADQTPSPERAYWTEFLNQDTPVFTGTGVIAKKLGYPVVYLSIQQSKRGHYEMHAEVLVPDPKSMSENDINQLHTDRLQRDIRQKPDLWLWTHRRWKHRRPPA